MTYPGAAFYTGTGQSGKEIAVDFDSTGCETLPEAALSAANFSNIEIDVYYNADCQGGKPGTTGTTYFVLGGLHPSTFPFPAVSYRIRG